MTTQPAISHSDHSRQIQAMFSSIAPRYDLLNALLSCGRDRVWRKKAVSKLAPADGERILDIATGTGDVVLEMACSEREMKARYFGVDFSPAMLELAVNKTQQRNLHNRIRFQTGSAEALPYQSGMFDGAIVAFGVRNFSDVPKGLGEIHRVLKPGGRLVVLEFTLPTNLILRWGYQMYFQNILPMIGRMVSKHSEAYSYLPESVNQFAQRENFISLLKEAGFSGTGFQDLTLGVVAVYSAVKEP